MNCAHGRSDGYLCPHCGVPVQTSAQKQASAMVTTITTFEPPKALVADVTSPITPGGFNTLSALEWCRAHEAVVTCSPTLFRVGIGLPVSAYGQGPTLVHAVWEAEKEKAGKIRAATV